MNEQLKQMLRTAWEKAEGPSVQETMFGKMTDFREELMNELENVFTEFAELIVRECAAEAHRRVCVEGNDNMIYAHLLEHFGVEE